MLGHSRYSHQASRALTHAQALAAQYRHPFIDTGHILVGVMLTEGSIGYKVLREMNLSVVRAESQLRALYPLLDLPNAKTLDTGALEKALVLAEDESNWLGHYYIGTEHLLLGITRTNAGNAGALLRRLNTSSEQVSRRVRRALKDGATELDLQVARRSARLSELSRRVITAAEQMAVAYDHPTVGLGHLLLALLLEKRSPVSTILRESNLDAGFLRNGLSEHDPLLLANIEIVLSQALDEGEDAGSHYTGTEHLLLTLTINPEGIALLTACGLEPGLLRHRLQAHSG
jgi:ATP-dependent Clp protease ATP-binding subunit ClpA